MRDSLISNVLRALTEENIPFALIGAVALAARGVARDTTDVDLLTTDARALSLDWNAAVPGSSAHVRRGEHDDPLAGVVTFSAHGDDPVDLVIGRRTWQQQAVARAERLDLGFANLPVLTSVDLVLTKLDAGGPADFQDVGRLLELHGPQFVHQIDSAIPDVQSLRDQWTEFRRLWNV